MTTTSNHQRLPRHTSATSEGDVSRVMGKLEASGQVLLIQQLLANSPNGFRPFMQLSDALLTRARLPRSISEIVILYMAAKHEVGYEWAEHEPMALDAGVSPAQIDALRRLAPDASAFDSKELLALGVAEHLLVDRNLPEAMWSELVDQWGVEETLDLVFVVGWWGGFVPTCIAALGLTAADQGTTTR